MYADKCVIQGDKSMKVECDGEGITSYEYKDTECKEEVSKTL